MTKDTQAIDTPRTGRCRVCGFDLSVDPVQRDPDPDWPNIRLTAIINDYPGGPGYEVHSDCMSGKSPVERGVKP